ncbi:MULTISPECIES: hypothetical protein [Myxococcus]|uniref:hypothetical protein n=1 Tax=Myxococcus TaxID=32 RepID=UPI0011429637|nr:MULTISPECIES: hypothetical protein [Myxococcus]NOK02961.1 hypothetical protein [Myxococcus xanthus]
MRRFLLISVLGLASACGGPDTSMDAAESLGESRQRLALMDYQASNTTNATNPATSAHYNVDLVANEAVMIGTCGLSDATFTGDTLLRLYNSSATEVANNDQNCYGDGSKLSYTPTISGSYLIRAGCWSSGSCTGTVAIARRKGAPVFFSASNTNNAQVNTFNKQYSFTGGEVVRVSTCGVSSTGAAASGDTYLRLYRNVNGVFTLVASNDTAATLGCGTAAEIVYSVPASGYYQFRAGCAGNTACSGNVTVYVE